MPLAWIDPPNTVRDVAPGNPALIYHPDVAKLYTTNVPKGTVNGATFQDGEWVNPPPPPPFVPGPPEPPPLPTQAEYQAAIKAHVEATAQARSYFGSVSCASYVNSTVPAWAAEAAAFVAWRDQVWLEVYETLAAVQSGAPAPTIAGLVEGLPAMEWPA